MNLYHKKQRWKIALMFFATLLVAASLWFSYQIVSKVQEKEVDRIEQWAEAVKRKSELVKLTNQTFGELRSALIKLKDREREKVRIWALAIDKLNSPNADFDFLLEIISNNNEIPMILTDMGENIVNDFNLHNLDSAILLDIKTRTAKNEQTLSEDEERKLFDRMKDDSLRRFIHFWRAEHEPIHIDMMEGDTNKLFYFDSLYYKELRLTQLERKGDSLLEGFSNELITNKYLVPVCFIDQKNREILGTNMPDYDSTNASTLLSRLEKENDSIVVDLGADSNGVIYYEHSAELKQMKFFPFVQFFIIGLFILIAYLGFSTFRKAEQDQVWVGMAKETAHQLGTPISSLMAWNEILISKGIDENITNEINTDIDRLTKVTDRFSKIGSKSKFNEENVVEVLKNSLGYLRKRISDKVEIEFKSERDKVTASFNPALMEWVTENITKNAVDAMDGAGKIVVTVSQKEDEVIIDIEDDGKGIAQNKLKTVFQPGYTTKQRGWGLGLSLVKRIVEDFHKGKVYVLKSEVGVGTTFRILLKV